MTVVITTECMKVCFITKNNVGGRLRVRILFSPKLLFHGSLKIDGRIFWVDSAQLSSIHRAPNSLHSPMG